MGDSLPLGRIAGVRIGMNWSVLVIAAYLVYALHSSIFPSTNPGVGPGARLVMAVVAAVLFLVSILLHEVGHAVQARRDGMTIDGITLWMFGGVARFVGMFPGAGAEFRIAIAGPLVSLALGLGFTGIALVPGLPDPVDGVVSWLGYINLALLVFNLLPALPMDGGRVLRSAIWARTRDFPRATRIAGSLGRVFAWVLIGVGVVTAVAAGSPISGVWMALIGVFLLQASTSETRAAVTLGRLSGVRVADVMVPRPVTVAADRTLAEVAAVTHWTGAGYATYPVVDGEVPVGVLPVGVMASVPPERWETVRVTEVMVPAARLPVLGPGDPLTGVVERLQTAPLRRALVLDGGRLVGVLSLGDVARYLDRPAAGDA